MTDVVSLMLSIFKYYMMLRSKVFSGGRTDTRTLMYSLKVRKSQKIFFLETPLHKKRSNFFEGFDFLSYPFNLVRRESFIGKMSKKQVVILVPI